MESEQQDTQAAESAEQQQSGPDLSGLESRLEGLASGQEELRQFVQNTEQRFADLQGQPEPEPQEEDLSWLDPVNPDYDPQRAGQNLEQLIEDRANKLVESRLSPLEQRFQQREFEMEARDLVSEFPQLAEPEVAQQVAKTARELVEENGWPAELANSPRFWRVAYMAGRAAELANEENAAGGDSDVARLEGGGATPQAPGQDLVDRIFSGEGERRGSRALPF